MSDFNTQDDYYEEEEVQRQTRAKGRRGLPLWPLVVIVLLIAVVIISFGPDLFRPSPQPTVIIPTVTPALPTVAPLTTATPTPKPTPTPSVPTEIEVGVYVKVVNTEADGLRFRWGPGTDTITKKFVEDGTILKVLDGPEEKEGTAWWRLEDPAEEDEGLKIGWAAEWDPEDGTVLLEPTLPR